LANAINEKPTVIAQYENGTAIPNPSIVSKIERALGSRIPRSESKGTGSKKKGSKKKSSGYKRKK